MKTNIPSQLLRCLLVAGISTLAWTQARADGDNSVATAKLSTPGKPATFKVDMPWADIRIVGVDGNTVTVQSTIAEKGAKDKRSDGLRRLDDEVSFELTEKDNVVSLRIAGDNPWASHDAEFKISVPRAMALDIKTEAGGDLVVKDIDGDIAVKNMNGEVKLEGISGSTVVQTMNGEVKAFYAKAPQKLVSITSMNGEIDLRVPADTKANVSLRTHNGSILTDFDENALKTKSEGGKASGYNYERLNDDEKAVAHAATAAAADAVRVAVQVSRDVAREVERAVKEEAEADATAPKAATDARPPKTPRAPHTPRPAHIPRPPMPPITGGKLVSGTLNGGGVDIQISTMNGEITLRQSK